MMMLMEVLKDHKCAKRRKFPESTNPMVWWVYASMDTSLGALDVRDWIADDWEPA